MILLQESTVNKLGLAAPTSDLLDISKNKEVTEEELVRRKQVEQFVSQLTPEQVELQQKRVQVRWRLFLIPF